MKITEKELKNLKSKDELISLAKSKKFNIQKTLDKIEYEKELLKLQTELVLLQRWINKNKKRVAIIFEGRDAAGKGGAIKRFMRHLNPRSARLVALNKPSEVEKGQWYFRRYIKVLPNPGELVFFDRSWYNRAVVEPVMNFCTKEQYKTFMAQVPEFEHHLYEDGIKIIKFWFAITKEEQKSRFDSRILDPLKRWKFSPVDIKGQELWDNYSHYRDQMFSKTHTSFSPWTIIETNNKREARLESIRHVLSQFDYDEKGKTKINIHPDPNVVKRYFREILKGNK